MPRVDLLRTWVINLDRAPDRLARIRGQLERLGLPFERLPAVDAPTRRELQVLAEVARGLSNVEIGRSLHISEATVKTHLVRVFEKLGVSDRTAAVTTALSQGLLPPP